MADKPTPPTSVKQYLDSLPADRREALQAIREVILANLDPAFEEGIQYGMIGYYLPHSVYPKGYHCDPRQPLPFVQVASQKNHIGLYLFCVYLDQTEKDRFVAEWTRSGKKLDMGAACVRVKNLEGVALDAVGRAIKRMTAKKFVKTYETMLTPEGRAAALQAAGKSGPKKKAAKKTTKKVGKTTKKAAAKKVGKKKVKKAAT